MKKRFQVKAFFWRGIGVLVMAMMLQQGAVKAAAEEATIAKGLYVEGMDMSGMTKAQATSTIESYVYRILEGDNLIKLQYDNIAEKSTNAGLLGAEWSNREIVDELLTYGGTGNVVERYKSQKDLEHNPINYEVKLSFDEGAIAAYIEKYMAKYDEERLDYRLSRKNNKFQIVDGETGYEVNVSASAAQIAEYLNTKWDRSSVSFPLIIEVTQPRGSQEELLKVTDVIGSFSSSFAGGTAEKMKNISNGATLIDGITLYPGDEFSFDSYAAPYTVANGYAMGKSYSGGKLVDDVGGGICQVSSTLYNAALRAELDITMRYNHSMIVGYVPISSDATLAETAGKDFRFKNNQEVPIYIEAYLAKDQKLVVNVYGKETRASNRTVEFISETVEVIPPGPDVIHTDGNMPVGEIIVSSAYTGYKAKLWKVVKVNGKEQSRELVNNSNYRAVARMATVGMYTTDPAVLEQMNVAVATGNIDHVKNVIAAIMNPQSGNDTE